MNLSAIKTIYRPLRVTAGVTLVAYAVYSGNAWFYLGFIPMFSGIVNFCPACVIFKKCDITKR